MDDLIQGAGPVAVLMSVVLTTVYMIVNVLAKKNGTNGYAKKEDVERLHTELVNLQWLSSKIFSKTNELWNLHNVRDPNGIPVWYRHIDNDKQDHMVEDLENLVNRSKTMSSSLSSIDKLLKKLVKEHGEDIPKE